MAEATGQPPTAQASIVVPHLIPTTTEVMVVAEDMEEETKINPGSIATQAGSMVAEDSGTTRGETQGGPKPQGATKPVPPPT